MSLLTADFWGIEYFGNSLWEYAMALAVFAVAALALKIVQKLTVKWSDQAVERTDTKVDDALMKVVKTIKPPFYWFLAFWAGLQYLELRGIVGRVVDILLLVWVVYQAVVALQILIEYAIKAKLIKKEDRSSEVVSGIVMAVTRIVLWVLAVLFILQNLGVEVTSLIAGVGIFGLAVALAAQKIFEDLFSSLAIYFDEPFEPGDFVKVGNMSGTVERVGIKTTRFKSLSGEQVTVPNKDITSSQVYNFKRMVERRVEFEFGVTYDTGVTKLRNIPKIVEGAVEAQEKAEFKRANFKDFGDSALVFEVVYKISDRMYEVYTEIHEEILLSIKREFEKEGIEMAYPTQTIHVVQGG